MRGPRTLRSRLFSWFFGAIVLAILTSSLVVWSTRPDATTGVEEAAQHMAMRLAADWDDPQAVRAYVDEIRDVTGFDVRLVRDARKLPPFVHHASQHGVALVPSHDKVILPVVRNGVMIGALEMDRFGVRPAPWGWWRLALALFLVVAVLSIMASRIANQLARPLEQLAHAADRFGGGDLSFRSDVARARRWVALEVRDVAVSFNRMSDRVEAMVRGQRELLGAISHELRSPLGRARVALEIARDRLPPAESAPERSPGSALDDVEKQLGAVDSILGDLLDVTRAGLADLRKETRPFVDWLRARVAEEPTPPAVTFDVSPEAQDLALPFDGPLLARAVHNLLLNARAHGHPDDRPLEVRVTRDASVLRVVVRDRGPGFPPGLTEHAFEPFVRGDAARSRPVTGAGYGLGLAIVRRIVEAHGGRAFARNATAGPGAEAGFELPAPPAAR
ncbi:MAG TPA: HAMP domain-containing sensor histidine kinase [Polyangiaceae bacterium]